MPSYDNTDSNTKAFGTNKLPPNAITPTPNVTRRARNSRPPSPGRSPAPRIVFPQSVPIASMNTLIGTIADSAAATPITATAHDGSECITTSNSARSGFFNPGVTNKAVAPIAMGTNSNS